MALFCTDIDGTLLNPERTLSGRTIASIRAVQEAGHKFVLCSSRMPESMRILERLYSETEQPLIAYNGGLVLTPDGRVLQDVSIAPDDARTISRYCSATDLHVSFFAGEYWHAWRNDQWTAREINNTGVRPTSEPSTEYIESGLVDARPPHKAMCMGDPTAVDGLEALLSTHATLTTYRSKDTYLEIASSRCSKGTGVQTIATELGIPKQECYFFGDNFNDLPAFSVVGTSIAVANGKQAILDAATTTTGRHHDDGVAAFLDFWLTEARM